MEPLIIGFLILTVTLLNSLPLIIGLLRQTPYTQFLGVVHHPQDYFYYLSQFTQGQTRLLTGFDLLTTEFRDPAYVGWINILLGRFFSIFGVSPIIAYQISVILLTILFLILVYILIGDLTTNSKIRIAAFVFFIFANYFPTSPIDYWFNLGNPFNRLGSVPHQLLANAAIVAAFLVVLRGRGQILLIPAGLILASTNPVSWILVVITLAIVSPIAAMLVGISGLPMAMYIKNLFSELPYSQLAAWEASQQIRIAAGDLLRSWGVTGIFGLLGIPLLWKRKTQPLFIYALMSLILYFSALGPAVHISNTRFMSPVVVLAAAVSAGILVARLPALIYSIILAGAIVSFIPGFQKQLEERTHFMNPTNAYYYLPESVLEIFEWSKGSSGDRDSFLVIGPFSATFSGLTGRRQFNGHPLLTINPQEKDRLSLAFFDSKMSEEGMKNLLREHQITFVITYPWTFREHPLPFLFLEFANNALALYKVKMP